MSGGDQLRALRSGMDVLDAVRKHEGDYVVLVETALQNLAELRGFAETVASQSPEAFAAPRPLMTLNDLIDEANELLAKIDKGV